LPTVKPLTFLIFSVLPTLRLELEAVRRDDGTGQVVDDDVLDEQRGLDAQLASMMLEGVDDVRNT
jgi:hypothetical protein